MSSGGFFRINSEKWLVARGPWQLRNAQKIGDSHFRAPDFFLAGLETAWIPEKIEILSVDQLTLVESSTSSFQWSEGDRETFVETHRRILKSIRQGEFQKMVPFTEFFAESSANQVFDPLTLVSKMAALPANLYPYGFWNEEGGIVGATPELLYQRKGSVLHTMALAGTAPIDDPAKLDTAKERDEHQIVIDGMHQVLSLFGSVRIGETKIIKYTQLCHLKTEIEVDLFNNVSDMDLIRALHPTAALGGWPREASRRWHAENTLSRGRGGFGAPMLIQNDDQVWVLVAIRGIQWTGSRMCLRVGCGVVEGSEAGSEWNELLLKKRATLRGLGLE